MPLRRNTSPRSSIPRVTSIHSQAVHTVATADCVGPRADSDRMNQKLLPFIGTEALAAGTATRRTLASRHNMVYRNVYLQKGLELTPQTRAVAAWLWSQRNATIAGMSAAALHGSQWIDRGLPAELIRSDACDVDGIVIHRTRLRDDEICVVYGMPVTTPARTAFDLGRRDGIETAIIRVDALAHATGLKRQDVERLAERRRGARGIVQLRRVVDLMDGGAESPQETRTRLLLIAAGFRKPQTQIVVTDEYGEFVGRVDMGWAEWKVGVEYDGPQHWDDPEQHARDIDRLADLAAQGWMIIRVSRDLLRYRPHVFLARVRDAMRAAGWPHWGEIRLDARISWLDPARRVWA
jgi:very-short-patch-repair endonuclease